MSLCEAMDVIFRDRFLLYMLPVPGYLLAIGVIVSVIHFAIKTRKK